MKVFHENLELNERLFDLSTNSTEEKKNFKTYDSYELLQKTINTIQVGIFHVRRA
jgi:hypothetical protein